MAVYQVPAALIVDYGLIKTALQREYCLHVLAGKTQVEAYRAACKKLRKKPSQSPRDSAYKIHTNSYVFSFITKAFEILSITALQDAKFSFQTRLDWTQKVIETRYAQLVSGESTNASDILTAIKLQNDMLGTGDRFKEKSLEELQRLAGAVTGTVIEHE